ncbi:hypothetical protein [Actinoplanes sp. NPDC049802]|uniref:hypothetical protein n=1 Tax=Actinoplanes sp. NPDC049802 TaxID=3154742 RepID=UPI0033EB94FE
MPASDAVSPAERKSKRTLKEGRAPSAPIKRVIALLRILTGDAHSHRYETFTDNLLMEKVDGYGKLEGKYAVNVIRMLNHDKAALQARGLIERVPLRTQPPTWGTRRAEYPQKDEKFWMDWEELDTLRRVRQARIARRRSAGSPTGGFPVGPTSPPTDRVERGNTTVDDALRLLRLLEENDGSLTVEEIIDYFGIGERRARNWLIQVYDGLNTGNTGHVTLETTDDDRSLLVLEQNARHGSPFAQTGTALLGLFGYSRAEVAERLELIAEHRRLETVDPSTEIRLSRIERKLRAWGRHLAAIDDGMPTETYDEEPPVS